MILNSSASQHKVVQDVWKALDGLTDPEIPVITLREMGIIRDVEFIAEDSVVVVITPTYSGCPAMEQIHDDVRNTLKAMGLQVEVRTQLAPAWTTDWMTDIAKDKLKAYGIAPPNRQCGAPSQQISVVHFLRKPSSTEQAVECPRCGSSHTFESSKFGSTACKALYKCLDCQEPFDYFKPY
ncbi:1,2-phenylacetyl-CoA epoxidase subunit PaaD [Limnohabitans sp.]|uniref:1,2-phenylacetyl-CoA epoxidase subunit PaaD n=1 Tax=Limnohabitans sp. TaxID=1907725 RepID=UPI003340D191